MKLVTLTISAASLVISASFGFAQGDDPHGPPGPGGEHRPPPPIIAALDLNHDGVISADEIKKAPESLLKLDKNGDGQLTPDELRPPPPPPPNGNGDQHGGGQGPQRQGTGRPDRP